MAGDRSAMTLTDGVAIWAVAAWRNKPVDAARANAQTASRIWIFILFAFKVIS
jgi:hypothetical protein